MDGRKQSNGAKERTPRPSHFHEWPLENLENPTDRDALTTTHDNNR